jgi:D-arabinose 1-dehydrogenase-like Zn-dependent alcohol dehydrogenase
MGHEYVGLVEEVGSQVTTIEPGQFVIGSVFASDNTCEICRAGYQSPCIHREAVGGEGAQAERLRVPLATARSWPPRTSSRSAATTAWPTRGKRSRCSCTRDRHRPSSR